VQKQIIFARSYELGTIRRALRSCDSATTSQSVKATKTRNDDRGGLARARAMEAIRAPYSPLGHALHLHIGLLMVAACLCVSRVPLPDKMPLLSMIKVR
jgi:hypothetical protein